MAKENNYAFIDSNNLYQGLSKDIIKKDQKVYSGWQLDYKRFRVYLSDKYGDLKEEMIQDAKQMGHSSGTQREYILTNERQKATNLKDVLADDDI